MLLAQIAVHICHFTSVHLWFRIRIQLSLGPGFLVARQAVAAGLVRNDMLGVPGQVYACYCTVSGREIKFKLCLICCVV